MTKPKQSIVDKVAKLLALADQNGGGTAAERETAQRKAADLMTRHQITLLDVDDKKQGAITAARVTIDGMTEHWRGELPGYIAQAMGGDYYYVPVSRTQRVHYAVGRPETIAFARTLTDSLIPYLEIECEAALQRAIDRGVTGTCSRCDGLGETRRLKGGGYTSRDEPPHTCPTCEGTGEVPLNRRVFRREFYDAAARAVRGRLIRQRAQTANEVSGKGGSTALVRSDKAAVAAYYEAQGIKLSSSSSYTTGGAAEGRAGGRDAAERADLAPSSKVTRGSGRALPAGSAA